MLLTLQSGLESLAPKAHQIPVYPRCFRTFLLAAFTAHGHKRFDDTLQSFRTSGLSIWWGIRYKTPKIAKKFPDSPGFSGKISAH
jgi:hypothetical protein